ncbi:MAG: AMP-dependent synthetase/ligase [Thermoanaerobaculia bacterium]
MHRNFVEIMLEQGDAKAAAPHFRFFRDGAWREWTYGEVREKYTAVAGALVALGIEPGDRVAIFAENSPEWAITDFGAIGAGATVVSIYATLPADEAAYILNHSESRVLFAGDWAHASTILGLPQSPAALQKIVLLAGTAPESAGASRDAVISFDAFLALAQPGAGEERLRAFAAAGRPETPIVISYTSGTTGVPKGVVLTHGNVLSTVENAQNAVEHVEGLDSNLSFLPLAHVLERFGGHWWPLARGVKVCYARSLETAGEDFVAVRPAYAVVVPRVLEKVHTKIYTQLQRAPKVRRQVFHWAVAVARRWSDAVERQVQAPVTLKIQHAIADRLVYRKIRERLGGRLVFLVCGGAPLAADLARFFHGMGVMICEGWGLTETSAPATLNTPSHYRFGSVGRALPGVEVKLAEDGELLVRGPNVFQGYFKDPEGTRDAFDDDGFFRTGDIGDVDDDGYFYVTDRKKELIITAGGKNIAPQKIENILRERRYVSNCLVHGDRRHYLVALITVDRESIRSRHPEVADRPVDDINLRTLIERQVEHVNNQLARFEQIKDFRIIEHDFTPENGELTVTMKLKRRVVEEKYREVLDGMYGA